MLSASAQIPSGNFKNYSIINAHSSDRLSFLKNDGQFGEKTLFKTESGGASFFFCKDEVAYLFARNTGQLEKNNPDSLGFSSRNPMGLDLPLI